MKWIVYGNFFGRCLLLSRRSLFVALGFILAGVLFHSSYQHTAAGSQNLIYGVNRYGNIAQINLSTGVVTAAGTLSFGTQAADQDHITSRVYYFDLTELANRFAYWEPATGNNFLVTTYSEPFFGFPKRLAFDADNNLYMMNADDVLYVVDKDDGALTSLGEVTGLITGSLGGTGDIVFGSDGTLYLNTYGNLYTVDLNTNEATLVFANMFSGSDAVWTGLAYCDGQLYGSAVNFDTSAASVQHINSETGVLTEIFSTTTDATRAFNDLTSCPIVPLALTLSHFQVQSIPFPVSWLWGGVLLTTILSLFVSLMPAHTSVFNSIGILKDCNAERLQRRSGGK
jgi:hypothetical protein